MKKMVRRLYARIWIALRLLRLRFVRIPESKDAKSQEQMLKEIRKKCGMD